MCLLPNDWIWLLQQLTESRMQELLTAGDFAGAISLLVECQGATTMYRHFSCVAALSTKLQDTLVMAEEQLDQALAQVSSLLLYFYNV